MRSRLEPDPTSFLHIAATILAIHCRLIARRSRVAERANSILKEAIRDQLFLQVGKGNAVIIPAFGDARQIVHVFHERLVIGNRNYHRDFVSLVVGKELSGDAERLARSLR